jgi:hypothetical protein
MDVNLSKCPVCSAQLRVTRLYCSNCDTTIEGHFVGGSAGPFSQLTPEQVQFVLTFVKCEGRFNRMEDELNLSYPTIRNRLFEVIRALGFDVGKEDAALKLTPEDRKRILDDVEAGQLTVDQAQQLLTSGA